MDEEEGWRLASSSAFGHRTQGEETWPPPGGRDVGARGAVASSSPPLCQERRRIVREGLRGPLRGPLVPLRRGARF